MGFQWWQFLLIAVLVMLLFGRGKISGIMGDVADGIKSFRKGMREDDDQQSQDTAPLKTLASDASERTESRQPEKTETKVS